MFMDGTTTYSCNTLVAGLILQSTPIDWWCLYWIHRDMDPSVYTRKDAVFLNHLFSDLAIPVSNPQSLSQKIPSFTRVPNTLRSVTIGCMRKSETVPFNWNTFQQWIKLQIFLLNH